MQLREHQIQAIEMARQSIKRGLKRPVIAAPTSFGKTVVAGQILKNCQDMGKSGWFFCDRINLVNQTVDKFREMGINFGVRQAQHDLHNPEASIQIASIQTIQALVNKHKGRLPEFDLAIVDECHLQWDIIKKIIEQYNNIPIIGLSATPYSKGLGKYYNNLIVPITPRELLEKEYLCPVRYFGGEHIDLSKIRSSDANTYRADDLEKATEGDKERLTGCIIKNWIKHGENSQTIAFSPSQAHSKFVVDKLNEAGISAEHIDCYTDDDDRQDMYEAHNNGEFKVLSCSRLLNTGYDAPSVRCIIDCYPVKSVTTYVQRVGRLMRIFEGKDYAIYLDHADNFDKFGYAEDIVPESLHDGESAHRESEQIKQKDKKEAKTRDCPQCMQKMAGFSCKSCGYETPIREQLEDDGSILKEISVGNAANKKDCADTKTIFLSQMIEYAKSKNYKSGYAASQYKEKYGVWPSRDIQVIKVSDLSIAKNWVKSRMIKRRAAEKKHKEMWPKIMANLNE